jgi:hypothetical protein
MLSEKYKLIAQFMVDNKLKLSDDKTLIMMANTAQTLAREAQVPISTPTETIRSTTSEKLFGCWIHEDLELTEHTRNNNDNLLKYLTTGLGQSRRSRICPVSIPES